MAIHDLETCQAQFAGEGIEHSPVRPARQAKRRTITLGQREQHPKLSVRSKRTRDGTGKLPFAVHYFAQQ
jgi:hypothetical protein